MTFRDIPIGELFEYSEIPGEPLVMIKTGERKARSLLTGAETEIHLNKKVEGLRATNPGKCAYDQSGHLLIVEPVDRQRLHCQRVITLERLIMHRDRMTFWEKPKDREEKAEGYIILSRALERLEGTQKLLESVKVLMEHELS